MPSILRMDVVALGVRVEISGATTGLGCENPSFTFRLEPDPRRVVCLGPKPRSHLQLSQWTAETFIEHLQFLPALTADRQRRTSTFSFQTTLCT
jgi:hypothetical protein